MSGSGNVLDLIRSGRVPSKVHQQSSRMKTQYKQVHTFLLKKVSVFLKDDKLLFLPLNNEQIIQSIQEATARDRRMYFNVLEVGVFEQMIEFLRPNSPEEEAELNEAYQFFMDNSKDLASHPNGLQPSNSKGGGHPMSQD